MGAALRRWGLWAVLAVAVAAALAVGADRPSHPTLEQRTQSLAAEVRCPVCAGESAAQSQVPAAVAIRSQIHQELASGTPSNRVLADVVRSYGTGILERPPARGIGLVVWIVPVVAVVAAAAGLVLAFGRWRRRAPTAAGNGLTVDPADEALVARARRPGDAAAGDGGR